MDAIRNWLNSGREYHGGVQLYVQHGTNELLKKLFTVEGFSEFKQQQLEKALTNLLQQSDLSHNLQETERLFTIIDNKAKSIVENGIVPVIPPTKFLQADGSEFPKTEGVLDLQKRKGWRNPMDSNEQALFERWKPLHAEMLDLQARLEDVARAGQSDATKKVEAGRMALRIIALDKQCDQIYTERDHYLKTGKLMEDGYNDKPLDIPVDPVKWPLRLQNHQRYLREYKATRQKQTDPEKQQKLDENIAHQERMVAEYKKRLNLE
jgi:hypothetical protein